MFITFNVILDDIVFPDGVTRMGVLGGGGPQTAFGLRLWGAQTGLSAGIGPDLSQEVEAWLVSSGIDTHGLRRSEMPTPRAWQLMEVDGRRTQVWRLPPAIIGAQLAHRLANLPESYRQAHIYHMGIHPNDPEWDFLEDLKSVGGRLSLEPFKPADRQIPAAELRRLLSLTDVFSPNLLEAASILGPGEPLDLVNRLLDSGAAIVSLRMGNQGSIVASAEPYQVFHIPAVNVCVVDPVGAGNAYCGGFLAGLYLPPEKTASGQQCGARAADLPDLVRAGCYGAVAASFLVEQIGLPDWLPGIQHTAAGRLSEIADLIEQH